MAIQRSQKILLITDNLDVRGKILPILARNNLSIAEDPINLHSVSAIKKEMQGSSSTTFLRTALLNIIRNQGYPFAVALDFRINSGLPGKIDPDGMKVLRTFLISYIILARGRGFENIRANFIFLGGGDDRELLEEINTKPQSILNLLATRDPLVNGFIEELKNSAAAFNRLFFLKGIENTLSPDAMQPLVSTFLQGIKAREQLCRGESPEKIIENGDFPPAAIVYRAGDQALFKDGEMLPVETEDDRKLEKDRLYIIGHWTNRTLMQVAEKLTSCITRGIEDEVNFQQDDEIIIDMTERCKIDATTTSSLAQLLGKELFDYKNIRILITRENEDILAQSKGFSLIRKNLRRP